MRSRRSILASLTASGMVASTATAAERSSTDCKLVALGRQFDTLTAQIDHAIEDGTDIAWEVLHQLDGVEAEIVATPGDDNRWFVREGAGRMLGLARRFRFR